MRAELRGFFATDLLASGHEPSLETFRPDDDENFGLRVTAFIGPNDQGSEEEFDFFVCSARWLAEHPPEKGFSFLRGHLVLTRWDYAVLERALRDLCFRTEEETWEEAATQLSRYALWSL